MRPGGWLEGSQGRVGFWGSLEYMLGGGGGVGWGAAGEGGVLGASGSGGWGGGGGWLSGEMPRATALASPEGEQEDR